MIGGKMPKRTTPPAGARKVPGLKAWVTEEGMVYGPYGLKQSRIEKGSPTVRVMREDGGKSNTTVARLVATVWVEPYKGISLAHLDGDPENNSASNLVWRVTRADTQKAWNARVLEAMQADAGHRTHGTPTGYNVGCRCDMCRAAEKVEHMKRVTRKTIREVERICGKTAR